jgi:hypothetical protein
VAVYFRVHPDKSNRDIFDDDSRLFNADFVEVQPDEVHSNDVLITATPDEFETILAARA